MKKNRKSRRTVAACLLAGVVLGSNGIEASLSQERAQIPQEGVMTKSHARVNWQEFQAPSAQFSIDFPGIPENFSDQIQEEANLGGLECNAFIAALDPQTVFMLFVAQYPDFAEEAHAQIGWVLHGILNHHPDNELLFADLTFFQGHPTLDFFIHTEGDTYFKGRAIMVESHLYLMAMECNSSCYNEAHYLHFVNSFHLLSGASTEERKTETATQSS